MGREGVRRLRRVSVSQGLMLESASPRLLQPGGPHHSCPDKVGPPSQPAEWALLVGLGLFDSAGPLPPAVDHSGGWQQSFGGRVVIGPSGTLPRSA